MARPTRVIIESPFGTTPEGQPCSPAELDRNERYLDRALAHSMARGEAPFASHGLYPRVMRESIPSQRRQGIEAGLAWGEVAELVAVYADHGVTNGMTDGIVEHERRGLELEYRFIGAEWDARSKQAAIAILPGCPLTPGRWYRITKISLGDPNPTCSVGDVLRCDDSDAPGCIASTWSDAEWFADYRGEGEGYGTMVAGVEEVPEPGAR